MIIVVFLSVLLPLQASLTHARALGMAIGKSMIVATSVTDRIPLTSEWEKQPSYGDHHDHHRGAHSGGDMSSKPLPSTKSPGHHTSHQQSASACDSCAKCCLAGAAAPPMIGSQAPSAAAVRVTFSPASDTPSCFIPDGPERPPRCL